MNFTDDSEVFENLYWQYNFYCNKAGKGDYNERKRMFEQVEFTDVYAQYLLNSASSY